LAKRTRRVPVERTAFWPNESKEVKVGSRHFGQTGAR
jgi:hypothetical protein